MFGYDSAEERLIYKQKQNNNSVVFSGVVQNGALKTGGMNFSINLSNGIVKLSAEGSADMSDPRITNYSQARSIAKEDAKLTIMKDAAVFFNGVALSYMAEVDYGKLVNSKISAGFSDVHIKNMFEDTLYYTMEKDISGKNVPVAHLHMACIVYDSENPATSMATSLFGTFAKSLKTQKYEKYSAVGTKTDGVDKKYSCLVIDLRKMNFAPAMFPIITVRGNAKKVIYSGSELSKEMAGKYGTVCYIKNLEKGKTQERLLKNGEYTPLVIKATALRGRYFGNIQVSKNDAVKIYKANLNSNILTEGRVAILVK